MTIDYATDPDMVPSTPTDRAYLIILSIIFYLIGGHFILGIALIAYFVPEARHDWVLIPASILMLAFALVFILSAYFLSKARHRWFSLVTAGIIAIGFPIGTIIGGGAILLLCRKGVRQIYAENATSTGSILKPSHVFPVSTNQFGEMYLTWLKVLVVLLLLGILTNFVILHSPAVARTWPTLLTFGLVSAVEALYICGALGIILLRMRSSSAAPTATKVFNIALLFMVPYGTVVGIYGLRKVDKG